MDAAPDPPVQVVWWVHPTPRQARIGGGAVCLQAVRGAVVRASSNDRPSDQCGDHRSDHRIDGHRAHDSHIDRTLRMHASETERSERSLALQQQLARTALGDRAAFAALYRDTGGYLLGVIVRIVGDRDLAEDVLQEVYVSVWRAAAGYDAQRSQPLTWLTSVARNRAIDALRRRGADPVVAVTRLRSPVGTDDDDSDPLAAVRDEADGPAELMERAAEAHGVQQCMETLSREQRQCLSLTYYRGLSHAETAEHLAQPLGTVKSWVRRALLAMRDCLGRVGFAG